MHNSKVDYKQNDKHIEEEICGQKA